MPNNEHNLIKPGSYRIMDAVIDDKMTVVIHWCKLFYSAAKPGTDARCEDYKGFVHNTVLLPQPFRLIMLLPLIKSLSILSL